MSSSLTRVAFSSRVLHRAVLSPPILQARYSSKTKSDLPTHISPTAPSLSKTGSETPSDFATSDRSPITTYPEEHEPEDVTAAAITSGAPIELQTRTVRIYKPSKAATQSSHWNGRHWKLDWDVLPKGTAWENPLMGWTSSADFVQGTSLYFKTKEEAIFFAEKQGYEYFVQEPNERQFKPKAYAANFTHSPKKLKIIRTK